MPTHPPYPTIPVATTDPASLLEAVIALKRTVEMLTGQAGGERYSPHVFAGVDPPTALHEGDFWLSKGDTFILNIWTEGRWMPVVSLPAAPSVSVEKDLGLNRFRRAR